jgi:hypothetical protein
MQNCNSKLKIRGLFRRLKPAATNNCISLSNNPQFLALIERSRERQKTKGGISTEEMRHRLRISKRLTNVR